MNKCLLLLPLLFFIETATAEVYKWTDSAGHVHFSDKMPKNAKPEKVSITTYTPKTPPATVPDTAPEATSDETSSDVVPAQK